MIYWVCITDLHLRNKNQEVPVVIPDPAPNVVLLGDIDDAANVPKKDVAAVAESIRQRLVRHEERYVLGNHEREGLKNRFFVKNGIYFTHGDLESNFKKWYEYRNEPKGAGWFKRNILGRLISEFEEIIDRKPKQEFLEAAAGVARAHDCHTYVCGHFHPKEKIEVVHKGVTIIILPKGQTVLYI